MRIGRVWQSNEATPYGIKVYTQGDCWVLAYYLAKEMNSSVALVGNRRWGHAVAEIPGTSKYLDIFGIQTQRSLLTQSKYLWRGGRGIGTITPGDRMDTFKDRLAEYTDHHESDYLFEYDKAYPPTYRTAQSTAKKLIRKYVT